MDIKNISSILTEITSVFLNLSQLIDKYKSKLPNDIYELVSSLKNHLLELQTMIFQIQQENILLQDEIKIYKEKIAEYEQWEKAEKEYKLFDFGNGVFIRSKIVMKDKEQLHWFYCPSCFDNRKFSPLTWIKKTSQGSFYKCPVCNAEFINTHDKLNTKFEYIPVKSNKWKF